MEKKSAKKTIEKSFNNKAKGEYMKKYLKITLTLLLLIGLVAVPVLFATQTQPAQASILMQDPPADTPEPGISVRPLLYIVEYSTTDDGKKSVSPWGEFNLSFVIGNNGKNDAATGRTAHARNIVLTFSSTVFDPLDGSVKTIYEIDANNQGNEHVTHRFKVNEMQA